jgi:hypothetical protein
MTLITRRLRAAARDLPRVTSGWAFALHKCRLLIKTLAVTSNTPDRSARRAFCVAHLQTSY